MGFDPELVSNLALRLEDGGEYLWSVVAVAHTQDFDHKHSCKRAVVGTGRLAARLVMAMVV